MTLKAFKSVRAIKTLPDPQSILSVARGYDSSLPPAAMPPAPAPSDGEVDEIVQLNIRVGRRLADWLADKALEEGVSQKVWICRALQVAGAPVLASDLTDRTVRRRRGR